MREKIVKVVKSSKNLNSIREAIVMLFEAIRKETGEKRIGYVAGIIGSDGPEKMQENRDKLIVHTEKIRGEQKYPIFSSTDIFTKEVYDQLEEIKLEWLLRRQFFIKFWREVLEQGKFTDIFMTPRWEESEGAIDEYETAKRLGITIHYVQNIKT